MNFTERSPERTVAVVGLGKIGLPLAVQYARSGLDVIGIDIDANVVATVNGGHAPFPGEAHLDEYLAEVITDDRLRATTDAAAAIRSARTIVVVVPLMVDAAGVPEFRAMDAATDTVGHSMQPGTLVLYETTLPVHTTRRRFAPALEAASGLSAGTDFHVAFSP
ncbi:MAG: NAD(P)-binding domain-containing protein, partial [Ilumatobacteraceae bacterium]